MGMWLSARGLRALPAVMAASAVVLGAGTGTAAAVPSCVDHAGGATGELRLWQ